MPFEAIPQSERLKRANINLYHLSPSENIYYFPRSSSRSLNETTHVSPEITTFLITVSSKLTAGITCWEWCELDSACTLWLFNKWPQLRCHFFFAAQTFAFYLTQLRSHTIVAYFIRYNILRGCNIPVSYTHLIV